jgi:galactokinase
MKSVAGFFGKDVLRDIAYSDLIAHGNEVRASCGDRALLRAIHFFNENDRVDDMADTLKKLSSSTLPAERESYTRHFFDLVNKSGASSFQLLQNIYSEKNPRVQDISLALALTNDFITGNGSCYGNGSCRVHGGGFAGTIQAYIPAKAIKEYTLFMESYFGADSVTVLRIRDVGAARLIL